MVSRSQFSHKEYFENRLGGPALSPRNENELGLELVECGQNAVLERGEVFAVAGAIPAETSVHTSVTDNRVYNPGAL